MTQRARRNYSGSLKAKVALTALRVEKDNNDINAGVGGGQQAHSLADWYAKFLRPCRN